MGKTEKPINFTASVITIINFVYAILISFKTSFTSTSLDKDFIVPLIHIPSNTGLILLIILEAVMGFFYKFLYKKIIKLDDQSLKIVIIVIIFFLSAWTSIFNIKWLLNLNEKSLVQYWFLTIISFIISNTFISIFIVFAKTNIQEPLRKKRKNSSFNQRGFISIFVFHLFCMLILWMVS